MRVVQGLAFAVALFLVGSSVSRVAAQMDPDRVIPDGGIKVAGWTGKIDPQSERQGRTINDAKFAQEGANFHITTGPAVTYWNPANKATGDYTVKASFNEPKFMDLNSHAHSYGIVIGGNDLGTDQQSYLYCAAYGTGTFIVRGFGPAVFQMNGRGTPSPAVHKAGAGGTAADKGQPVAQDIAMSVKGDKVSCTINGTEVWTDTKANVVTAGKLKSTDGVYGVRFTHNVEAIVSGFAKTN
jgi:hypothetical protein